MANMNQVCITGNLGGEPELRTTATGTAVLQMSVAVSERRKTGDTWSDYVNWIPVTVFGKRAESLEQYLHKGSKVGITGKLSQSQWEKDGKKHSAIKVVAEDIELLSPKQKDDEPAPVYGAAPIYGAPEPTYAAPVEEYEEIDIPF